MLFLGGRASLADGGYDQSSVYRSSAGEPAGSAKHVSSRPCLPRIDGNAGKDSLICRMEENPDQQCRSLEAFAVPDELSGSRHPETRRAGFGRNDGSGHKLPLLITKTYGRGRTAVFATGGDWRWQMLQPMEDMTHEMFWRQLLRWMVSDTPTRVVASSSKQVLKDEGDAHLRAEIRDMTYLPTSDAQVEAHISGPGGTQTVEMHPDPLEQGFYEADWKRRSRVRTWLSGGAARARGIGA